MGDSRGMSSVAVKRIENYEKYFSVVAKRRKPSALRELQKYVGTDLVIMAGGLPNGSLFPIVEADLVLRDGRRLTIDKKEMAVALQYGMTSGLPAVKNWLKELQRRVHNPPTLLPTGVEPSNPSDMQLIMTNGSQEGLSKTVEAVLDEGDAILIETATYSQGLEAMTPLGVKCIPVPCDSQGMVISELRHILENWDVSKQGRRPKILYCIPTGGNPTGVNWSLRRKRDLYQVAREFDFLILEDDPYYYLQYTRPLSKSLLSMDVDGRVIRLDSFSKVMTAGARFGFVSGPQMFVKKLVNHMDVSVGCTNFLTQTILMKVLDDFGHDGFLKHGDTLARFYRDRATQLLELANKHLDGLAEWCAPAGGFFMWIKLLNVDDSRPIVQRVIEKGAVLVDGHLFMYETPKSPYIRISFSYATEDEMDKAFSWLAEALREAKDQQEMKQHASQMYLHHDAWENSDRQEVKVLS